MSEKSILGLVLVVVPVRVLESCLTIEDDDQHEDESRRGNFWTRPEGSVRENLRTLPSWITTMNTNVRIERLPRMRVARFLAIGRSPELEAWTKLRSWAEPRGLLKDPTANPVFGFNNPSPSPGREEYGYEFWIRIEQETQVESGPETLDFPGGWYAVITHRGFPNPEVWMQLLEWVRNSPHPYRHTHEMERPHNPLAPESEMVFDLYLPIETKKK